METAYREQFIKFGLKVQYYRKLHGLTQEAFADAIGKSWSFVAKIESPTQAFGVSMETMFKIAEVLEIPVSKLFEDWSALVGLYLFFYRLKAESI